MDFKNPEILAPTFNYHKLLIKETLLMRYKNSNPRLIWKIFHPLPPLQYLDCNIKYLADAHFLC